MKPMITRNRMVTANPASERVPPNLARAYKPPAQIKTPSTGSNRSRSLERPVSIHEFHAQAAGFAIDGAQPTICEPLEQPIARVCIFQRGRALERAFRIRQGLCSDQRHYLFAQVRENDHVPRAQQREGGSELRRVLITAVGDHHNQPALSPLRETLGGESC